MAAAIASALACAGPSPVRADQVVAQLAAASARQVAVLDSVVNGQPQGPVFALVERGETHAIEVAALRRWRIRVPSERAFEFEDRLYVTVADLRGVRANIEQRTQRLLVNLPPSLLEQADIQFPAAVTDPKVSTTPLAGFLNYTLFGYTSSSSSYASGFFELGVSGDLGSLVNTGALNSVGTAGDPTNRAVRFDTAWRRDDRDGLRTLNVGDAFTQAGIWGRSVRFGGVQYGTNFQLQPELITYPLQPFSGTAVVPSTVDVFVNGSRIASQAVQPGPFSVNDVPLISGAGDVQLVVRDAFGQQQTITQPFYASRRLLRDGLDEYQLSVGAIRENYGLESFDYGSAVASGYWRRGISDKLTAEGRFEGDTNVRTVGATVDFSPGLVGILTGGAAVSNGDAGTGQLWLAGYEYQGRRFNFSSRSMWASPQFRLIGDPESIVLQRQSQAAAGVNVGTFGSVGVAWVAQRYRNFPKLDTAAVTYSATIAQRTFVTISLSRSYGEFSQTSAFATLTVPLGSRTSTTGEASAARSGDQRTSYIGAAVQQTLPSDEGFGYRLRATTHEQFDAGVGYTWPFGEYTVEASSFEGSSAARATATGGLGFVAGRTFASRLITDSFGLVRVGDIEGIRVFHEGNPIGRTDRSGEIVLSRMTPYTANRITIDERDIPIDVAIRDREKRIVPQFRSGTLAEYEARRRMSAILEARLSDGSYVPIGSEVQLAGTSHRYIVGNDGEIFIPDLPTSARFLIKLVSGPCTFDVDFQSQKEVLPKLGPFTCRSQTP